MKQASLAWKYLACLIGLTMRLAVACPFYALCGMLLAAFNLLVLLPVLKENFGPRDNHHLVEPMGLVCMATFLVGGASLTVRNWWLDMRVHPDADVREAVFRVERWWRLVRRP